MSKLFVNIGLSLDGYMAPEGMTMENWDKPEYKNWGAKRLSQNKVYFSALLFVGPRVDSVVPLWVYFVVFDIELVHLVIRNLLAGLILFCVQLRFHTQTFLGSGRSNQIHNGLIAHQRLSFPIQAA